MNYYDTVAKNYDIADRYGSISDTHRAFFAQTDAHVTSSTDLCFLDLGVGDGRLLGDLKQHWPDAELIGVDMSKEMLKLARDRYGIKTIHSDFRDAVNHIPKHSADVIIAHFIMTFLDRDELLALAQQLLKPGGVLSIASSTWASFPEAHKQLDESMGKLKLTKPLVNYWYQRAVKQPHLPDGSLITKRDLEGTGLALVDQEMLHVPLCFKDVREGYDYGFRAGWLPFGANYNYLPKAVIDTVCPWVLNRLLQFPLKDEQIIEVSLVQRSGRE